MSPTELASVKAANAPFVNSYFPAAPSVQVQPTVIPRAPGTNTPPIVSAPTVNFSGITEPFIQFNPPSPDVAVGPSDIVMVVNESIAQFSKTGAAGPAISFQDFFGSLLATICPTQCSIFDPMIRYDQLHGRFLFLATASSGSNPPQANLLVSITNGATYASGWKTWAIDATMDGSNPSANHTDFWRAGFDSKAVYLSGNMYNVVGTFQYAKIRVLLKSDLYNTAATVLPYRDLYGLKNLDGSKADSLTPAHQRGRPSGTLSPFLVNTNNITPTTAATPAPNYLTVWKLDTSTTPLGCTETSISVTPYDAPPPAPQLGGSASCGNGGTCLDPGDRRILKVVYRDGFLYTARDSYYSDAPITVTYDVIDTTNMTEVSLARILNGNAFYPSFDVTATTPAGIQFATAVPITGTTTDSKGNLTHPSISNLKAGVDFFDYNFGEAVDRWGDYFGGAVDPVTGGLWASGEYAAQRFTGVPDGGNGQWGSWIGYFPWLTAPLYTDVTPTSVYYDYINVLGLWQITTGCTSTTFCPTALVNRAQFAVFLARAMFGNPCTQTTTCSLGFTYTGTPYYADVPQTDSMFPYIQKLRDLGIMPGCSSTTFCPNDPVTRSTAAELIIRAKMKSLYGDNFPYPAIPYFADVPVSDSTYPFVQKLYEMGITSGCGTQQFCPNQQITRQEAAVLMVRGFLN